MCFCEKFSKTWAWDQFIEEVFRRRDVLSSYHISVHRSAHSFFFDKGIPLKFKVCYLL